MSKNKYYNFYYCLPELLSAEDAKQFAKFFETEKGTKLVIIRHVVGTATHLFLRFHSPSAPKRDNDAINKRYPRNFTKIAHGANKDLSDFLDK